MARIVEVFLQTIANKVICKTFLPQMIPNMQYIVSDMLNKNSVKKDTAKQSRINAITEFNW